MRSVMPLTAILFASALCPAQRGSGGVYRGDARQGDFFDPEVVQDIRLDVREADLERMRAALPERIYVPATFRWKDVELARVGLRYKGNSSSRPQQAHKRSFLVKFAEFEKKQRFLGLRRVALDNGVQFGSLFSERLITDILREVGVRASRSNYARVTLNGEFIGVYVNVERIDHAFVARSFPGAEGALYKNHTGGPGADLRYLGDDPLLYRRALELKSGPKSASAADLVRFIKGVDPGSGAAVDLRTSFDVDGFLWQMGVLLLAGAFDQYTGWGPHNYYLYHAPPSGAAKGGRWYYLTWDLDVGFADRAFGRVPVIDGWHAAWPVPVPGRPLLERIVDDAELLALYRARVGKLLETHFDPERLGRRLDRLYAQIEKDLERDPFSKSRITNRADRSYADVIASMKRFIAKRHETALAQLADPGERPAPASRVGRGGRPRRADRGRGPQPGASSADAPSELVVAKKAKDAIELAWKDNAAGERAFIVQRCTGATNERFRNLMGLPGENLTSATDRQVEPGKTYRYRVFAIRPSAQGAVATGVSNVVTVRF